MKVFEISAFRKKKYSRNSGTEIVYIGCKQQGLKKYFTFVAKFKKIFERFV